MIIMNLTVDAYHSPCFYAKPNWARLYVDAYNNSKRVAESSGCKYTTKAMRKPNPKKISHSKTNSKPSQKPVAAMSYEPTNSAQHRTKEHIPSVNYFVPATLAAGVGAVAAVPKADTEQTLKVTTFKEMFEEYGPILQKEFDINTPLTKHLVSDASYNANRYVIDDDIKSLINKILSEDALKNNKSLRDNVFFNVSHLSLLKYTYFKPDEAYKSLKKMYKIYYRFLDEYANNQKMQNNPALNSKVADLSLNAACCLENADDLIQILNNNVENTDPVFYDKLSTGVGYGIPIDILSAIFNNTYGYKKCDMSRLSKFVKSESYQKLNNSQKDLFHKQIKALFDKNISHYWKKDIKPFFVPDEQVNSAIMTYFNV